VTGPETDRDRELIEAAQGDPARFLELYDCHFHRVWAFAIRRAVHRAEAEDVVSETFRRALENLKTYESRGTPFLAWLLRIAANTLADRWQKGARESNEPPPDVAGPDEDLEQRALLYQLVERLPDTQRRVIELRYGEERSLAEVAEELGKSEGAVKQLQRRALEQLRQHWQESGNAAETGEASHG